MFLFLDMDTLVEGVDAGGSVIGVIGGIYPAGFGGIFIIELDGIGVTIE